MTDHALDATEISRLEADKQIEEAAKRGEYWWIKAYRVAKIIDHGPNVELGPLLYMAIPPLDKPKDFPS